MEMAPVLALGTRIQWLFSTSLLTRTSKASVQEREVIFITLGNNLIGTSYHDRTLKLFNKDQLIRVREMCQRTGNNFFLFILIHVKYYS